MSFLAIKNIPIKNKVHNMQKLLGKVIKGKFEIIGFGGKPKKLGQNYTGKVLYIRLAPNLNPARAIEAIHSHTSFSANVSNHVPNFLLKSAKVNKGKDWFIPKKNTSDEFPGIKLLLTTHDEILTEMQAKFTGLYNLAKKTNFELMKEIALKVFHRLKQIADASPEVLVSGFKFSNAYRKAHPHFGDFQLILSTLHKLQDAAGVPRAHIVEAELCQVSTQPMVINNVPMDKLQSVCAKYSDRIVKKIVQHVDGLEVEEMPSTDNAEEDAARKKVREQLKKLNPFMTRIVREVILNHFIPQKAPHHKVRVYGEPFLPNRNQMMTITKRCAATNVVRSDRICNLLKLSIPLTQYTTLFSQNGKELGGAKLYIRSSVMPRYEVTKELRREMKRLLGAPDDDSDQEMEEDDQDVVEMAE